MNKNISILKPNNEIEFITIKDFNERLYSGEKYEILIIATTGHIIVTPIN